jgi:hypothetical protein
MVFSGNISEHAVPAYAIRDPITPPTHSQAGVRLALTHSLTHSLTHGQISYSSVSQP